MIYPSSTRVSVANTAMLSRRSFLFASLAIALLPATFTCAQVNDPPQAMSNAEVDRLRDAAPAPNERVLAFISFLDQRTQAIQKMDTGRRHPGREEDIRDLMNQFTSICDDLNDNLDDYSRGHRDVRKVLPRLRSASERWATILRTPSSDRRYDVARRLALTSLSDVQESTADIFIEQKKYFASHPPAKED
jgi:hypothetical protein